MNLKPRQAAVQALIRWRREGAWPDLYLSRALEEMSPQAAALASHLTYGVLQQRELLDYYIGSFSSIKLKKITPQVLDILRVAVYQLAFLDKVPDFAAVNEAVELAKKLGNPRAAGFANALLRKIAAQRDNLPQPDTGDRLTDLSIRYSHPQWLTARFAGLLGEEGCEALLRANNTPPAVTVRVNTLKTTVEALLALLAQRQIDARPHDTLPHCLTLPGAAGLTGLIEAGLLYIQDAASQLCVHALAPRPGETVLDLCAAPGGKTLLAAQLMHGQGRVLAGDLHGHKVKRLAQTIAVYGMESMVSATVRNAARFDPELAQTADKIICDVPCSGLGIIRKKPDIRYKSPVGLEKLPELQYDILENAGRYLRPGGTLVYSTCTLLPEENEEVVRRFLAKHPLFGYEPFALPGIGGVDRGYLTLWPHLHGTDGFFMAKLRKET